MTTEQQDKIPTAASAAKDSIAASVETLHQALRPIASKMAADVISLYATFVLQDAAHKRLSDSPDVIPHSARISFEITGSKRVSEVPEFVALQAETKTKVDEFSMKL